MPESERFFTHFHYVVVLVAVVLIAGCDASGPAAGDVAPDDSALERVGELGGETIVATVDGHPISQRLLAAYLRNTNRVQADDEQRRNALNEMIDLILMADFAQAEGFLDRQSLAEERLVSDIAWVANRTARALSDSAPVTDAEIQAEYDRQVSRTGNSEYKLRHLLLDDEAAALAIIQRLESGSAFEDLEAQHAEENGISAAGELGWVNGAQLPEGFGSVVEGMQPGDYSSQPAASDFGFHVLFLEDKRTFDPPSLQNVREGIRTTIAASRLKEHLKNLRAARTVEVRI